MKIPDKKKNKYTQQTPPTTRKLEFNKKNTGGNQHVLTCLGRACQINLIDDTTPNVILMTVFKPNWFSFFYFNSIFLILEVYTIRCYIYLSYIVSLYTIRFSV